MDANAGSHGDDTKNAVPISTPEPQTVSGENQEGISSDLKRRFPPRKAAVPAKKKPSVWRILRRARGGRYGSFRVLSVASRSRTRNEWVIYPGESQRPVGRTASSRISRANAYYVA